MRLDLRDSKYSALFLILITVVISVLFGQIVTNSSYKTSLILAGGVVVFLVTLVNTDAGLSLLIITMLLSPEILLGRIPGRDIVIRIEDILLAIIKEYPYSKKRLSTGT
jgi:predicted neutral ceramidase superfamily lipid hydrolase